MKTVRYIDKVKNPLIKPCPCAKNHQSCGYVVISQILNCPYNCTYCYLNTFFGREDIVVYKDDEEIIAQTKKYMENAEAKLRIGTGEFSDSLALQDAERLSKKLIGLFAGQQRHLLELKTKSANIKNLLDLVHNERTVIGWSVNPESVARTEEFDAPGLADRLKAAKRCAGAGYPISFHFDPIIYFKNWEKEYLSVIERIFESVPAGQIAWISFGALRFPPKQKEIIQKKFSSGIDFKHLSPGKDHKLRYPESLRAELFECAGGAVRRFAPEVYIYLCMEEAAVREKAAVFDNSGKYGDYFRWSEVV